MKKYRIVIHMSKYMQHRMDDVDLAIWEENHGNIVDRPEIPKEDKVRADYHCHRADDNRCYIPAEQIEQSLINGGTQVKSKMGNSRRSMTNIVAGQFEVFPERIFIREYDEIDKRSAVNKNNGARVITVRPKWIDLTIEFDLHVNNDTITHTTIKQILYHAGTMFGIGSYRPQHKGKFGVFEVTSFKELKKAGRPKKSKAA